MIRWLRAAVSRKLPRRSFSLEAVVVGRNDNYEPNWAEKLFSSLAYNRRMFEGTGIDFHVAFVEWNPPNDRPLLAPVILEKFPFARVIVVDPTIHALLCEDQDLAIMMSFAYNAALRTSRADFSLITAGDEFFGSSVVVRIAEEGLEASCLYRAERVNVRRDLNFQSATTEAIESAENIVSIDSSTEPPYTNACGDFLLTDTGSMLGLRGFDESIRKARLHLDSRFAVTAMLAGLDCKMLGQIFHIDHKKSFRNTEGKYPGQSYSWRSDLPYLNPDDWGLGSFSWEERDDRLLRVSTPRRAANTVPHREHDGAVVRRRCAAVRRRLREVRRTTQPESAPVEGDSISLDLGNVECYSHWESRRSISHGVMSLETGDKAWGYAAILRIADYVCDPDRWYWVVLTATVNEGSIGIAFLKDNEELVGERYLTSSAADSISVPVPPNVRDLLFRNAAGDGIVSKAVFTSLKLVSQDRRFAVA